MREVGVLEAKTMFTSLIAEVERTAVAEDIIAWRDAQPSDDALAAMSWDDIKRAIRNEDRHD